MYSTKLVYNAGLLDSRRSRSHSGKGCAGAGSVEPRQEHKACVKIEAEEENTSEKEKKHDLRRAEGIPEEVQPATSDTVKVPTCQCLRTPSRLKHSGGLSSFAVGARWCLGQSPASFWVGRPCGRYPLVSQHNGPSMPTMPPLRPPVTCALAEPKLLHVLSLPRGRSVIPTRAER